MRPYSSQIAALSQWPCQPTSHWSNSAHRNFLHEQLSNCCSLASRDGNKLASSKCTSAAGGHRTSKLWGLQRHETRKMTTLVICRRKDLLWKKKALGPKVTYVRCLRCRLGSDLRTCTNMSSGMMQSRHFGSCLVKRTRKGHSSVFNFFDLQRTPTQKNYGLCTARRQLTKHSEGNGMFNVSRSCTIYMHMYYLCIQYIDR